MMLWSKIVMGSDEPTDIAQRKQGVAGVYSRAAPNYDRVGPRFFSHVGRRLIEIAQIPNGAKVLDVATGRGTLLFPAAESVGPQGRVIGIDLSETLVQETTKELARLKISPNVEVRQMDAEHLQFPDESFDLVLCGFAIFFFPQLDHAMSEFRRVLKPNGHICVSTWDKLWGEQWNWFYEIVEAYLPPEPETNQATESDTVPPPVFDTPEGLKAIINAAGFDNIQIFSEAAEFVYSTDEEFWSTLWSHGRRGTLEEIEQVTGTEGLEKFKSEIFRKMGDIKQTDGLHQLFPVLIGLATKPQA
jgi:O-methyltransferase/aklanonic acid methyltransferase